MIRKIITGLPDILQNGIKATKAAQTFTSQGAKICDISSDASKMARTLGLAQINLQNGFNGKGITTFFQDLSSKLFEGFTDRHIESFDEIAVDKLILTHMTDYLPQKGVIRTLFESAAENNRVRAPRDTLHFSLNHSVTKPITNFDGWTDAKYGILIPYDKIPKQNFGKIIGGKYNDFMLQGSFELPEGSIVIRKNELVPIGKAKISDASSVISELEGKKGIILIETAELPYKATDNIIEKVGYTNLKTMHNEGCGITREYSDLLNDSEKMQELGQKMLEHSDDPEFLESLGLKLPTEEEMLKTIDFQENWAAIWANFTRSLDLRDVQHCDTPFGKAEHLFSLPLYLSACGNKWAGKSSKGTSDYKRVLCNAADKIKDMLRENETLCFNLDEYKKIIQKSETPSEALTLLSGDLKTGFKAEKLSSFSEEEISNLIAQDFGALTDFSENIVWTF